MLWDCVCVFTVVFPHVCFHCCVPTQDCLEEAGIPYRIIRETSLLKRAAVQDVLAYVRLLLNPDDDEAFLRVYNTPRRRLGKAVEAALVERQTAWQVGGGERLSLVACAKEMTGPRPTPGLTPQQVGQLREFLKLLDELRGAVTVLRPPEVLLGGRRSSC